VVEVAQVKGILIVDKTLLRVLEMRTPLQEQIRTIKTKIREEVEVRIVIIMMMKSGSNQNAELIWSSSICSRETFYKNT
jgi:hypothetical protein